MNDISKAIYDIRKIDELGDSDTRIHKINSSIKIIVTIIYVIKILSIKQFTVINITCTVLYPLIIFIIGKVPIKFILKLMVWLKKSVLLL